MIRTHQRLVGLALAALVACGSGSTSTEKDAGASSSAHHRVGIGASSAGPVNIFGGLTGNKLPKASGGLIVDSDVSDTAGLVDLTNLAAKFTVAVATGNTAIGGTLAVTGLTTVTGGITGLPTQSCGTGAAETAQSTTGAQTCTTLIAGTSGNGTKFTGPNAIGNASWTDNGTTIDLSNGGGFHTITVADGSEAISSTATTPLNLSSTGATNERLRFSGHDWQSNTSTSGPAFVLGVNNTNDRRIWLVDSANETKNNSNAALQLTVSASVGTGIGAISTDGSTQLALAIQNGGAATNVGGALNITGRTTHTSQYTWVARQVLAGAYTPTSGTRGVIVRMCGGGGGGGGTTTTGAGSSSNGGGGASGAYIEFRCGFANSTIATGTTCTGSTSAAVGVAGTAGATAGGTGGTGGDTCISITGCGTGTFTAKGGTGGTGGAAGSVVTSNGGTVQSGSTSSGVDITSGQNGINGVDPAAAFEISMGGGGGSSVFGIGGASTQWNQNTAGNAATGKCSGGGGGNIGASTSAVTGGVGTAGTIVVDEYI